MGKMDEIKEHLKNGKSIKEVIELGFKKPSVYKVNKQLKDNHEVIEEVKESEEPENFHEEEGKEGSKVPKTVLDSTHPEGVGDNNPGGSNNPDPDNLDTGDVFKEAEPEINKEISESDAFPFREYTDVGISRHGVDVSPNNRLCESKSQKGSKTGSGDGKLGLPELLTEIYGTIAIITGHEHWALKSKDQKVIKHLCKLPGIEKFLQKFGLYGCVLSLFTITANRIKQEIKLKNESEHPQNENPVIKEIVVRQGGPANIMQGMNSDLQIEETGPS